VLEAGTLEIGPGDISYQTKLSEYQNQVNVTNNETDSSLYCRYAFNDAAEASLTVPYISIASKTDADGVSATTSDAGIGDALLSMKYTLINYAWAVSAGCGLSLPVGKQSAVFPESFRNGLNLQPVLMISRKYKKYTAHFNLSYNIKAEYQDANSAEINPGDILSAGAGLERPVTQFTELIGEFVYNSGEYVYNSVTETTQNTGNVSGASGTQLDVVLGLRYNKNSFRTKLGLVFSIGDEQYRDYDYKIIAGITYLWKV
jgi:hypothetical protein